MSLGLLAPAVLGVALLGGIAVLAHLQRRPPTETRTFGAMLLLARMQQDLQRRTRLQDRALLAVRLLALALVVLAAAQPELRRPKDPTEIGGTGRVVVVLDTSLSMDARQGGDPVYALARRRALDDLRSLPSGVQVAVVTAGVPPRTLTGWTTDAALAATLVAGIERQDTATDLHGALTLARSLLEGKPGEVLVYTDEAGPGVVAACAPDLERLLATGSTVLPRPFAPAVPRNVAPVAAEYGDGLEGGSVRVSFANWGPDAREVTATVELPDGARMTAFVEVPGATKDAPGSAVETYTVPRQAEGGVARVRIVDPDLPADDVRSFHLPQVGASRVLVVDGDPGSSPTRSEVYFLERALAPGGGSSLAVDVVPTSGLGTLDLAKHRVVILANVADPGPYASKLAEFVRQGGGLVLAMGDNVTADRWNTSLAPLLPASIRRPRDLVALDGTDPGMALAPPDLDADVLFKPFQRAGRDGFPRVATRRVMTVAAPAASDPDVRTLLRWSDGSPALLDRTVGNGRVLLWTSTLDLGWTNFPVQSVYMPFLQRLTAVLGGHAAGGSARADGVVGESVSVEIAADSAEVVDPGGRQVASERTGRTVGFVPNVPGAWSIRRADGTVAAWIAVQVPTNESDVRPGESLLASQAKIAPERMLRRWPLTTWLYVAAAGVLVADAWMGRGRAAATSETPVTQREENVDA